jgi:hypothetical protein
MSRKVLWIGVPVAVIAALVGVRALLASSQKSALEVVQPVAGKAYFPTATVTDSQGAVSVAVTQLNLNGPGDTLDFTVSMNTHSVNLDMDLVKNAFLVTDTGLTVSPIRWDAPPGGHHVSGTLSFSSVLGDKAVLDGATRLTLTIRNVGVPERVFTWEVQPAG